MYGTYPSPIGTLLLEEDGTGLCRACLAEAMDAPDMPKGPATDILRQARLELDEYFSGKRRAFGVPLSLKGTEFQRRVWKALQGIPYGQVCSYEEIARRIGNPKAARAVGMANHCNPVMILVPCHRVIGKDGSLTGYAAGLDVKKHLLDLERSNPGSR
ncbi:MAG: methylated-DNA--[Selenomonadaceae bacterium]|nr:methylated-DNA--[protein]-cysteine S-methyltransferase [Selenomonadaceae bacterium]